MAYIDGSSGIFLGTQEGTSVTVGRSSHNTTVNSAVLVLSGSTTLQLTDSGDSNSVSFVGPSTLTSSVTYTWCGAPSSSGMVLTSTTGGTLSWAAAGGLSLAAIGSSPNANGATISSNTLNLQPASASFGGVVTTGTQTFAGSKTFSSALNMNSQQINSVADPTSAQDAATKNYIDVRSASGTVETSTAGTTNVITANTWTFASLSLADGTFSGFQRNNNNGLQYINSPTVTGLVTICLGYSVSITNLIYFGICRAGGTVAPITGSQVGPITSTTGVDYVVTINVVTTFTNNDTFNAILYLNTATATVTYNYCTISAITQ